MRYPAQGYVERFRKKMSDFSFKNKAKSVFSIGLMLMFFITSGSVIVFEGFHVKINLYIN